MSDLSVFGLSFFALAVFTFLLCSRNPKIDTTVHLRLCLNLAFSHLLLRWKDLRPWQWSSVGDCNVTMMQPLWNAKAISLVYWFLSCVSTAGSQRHRWSHSLPSCRRIAVSGATAPPVGLKTLQGAGRPEWWPPRPLHYLKGLRVLFTIVGDGYGATEDKVWVVQTVIHVLVYHRHL